MGTGRLRVAVAVIAVLAFVGAACGNEGDDSSSGSASGTSASGASGGDQFADLKHVDEPSPCVNDPGMSDTDIKVGTIAVESGVQASSFAPALEGVKARIDKANQTGELGARKITLVVRDDAADQTRNAEVARDLVEQEKVFGIIEDTSTSNGSAKYLNEQAVPVAGWHVGVPGVVDLPEHVHVPAGHRGRAREGVQHPQREAARRARRDEGRAHRRRQPVERVVHRADQEVGATSGRQRDRLRERGDAARTARLHPEVQAIKDSGADGIVTGMDLLQNTALSDVAEQGGRDDEGDRSSPAATTRVSSDSPASKARPSASSSTRSRRRSRRSRSSTSGRRRARSAGRCRSSVGCRRRCSSRA